MAAELEQLWLPPLEVGAARKPVVLSVGHYQ